ncbi:ABC transporter, ATP-binding protein [Cooperia oncophora]
MEVYAYSSAAALANEVIAGIRTVMAFNAQPFEIHRYEKELKDARKMGVRKAFILAIFSALPLFLMFAAMAFSFWYGTTLVLAGTVTPGTIFAVFWSVLLGTRRLSDAAPQMGAFLGAKTAATDIFAIIDRVPDIDPMSDDGLTPEEFVGRISFNNVHFSYPSRPTVKVLDGVNYEVNPGETVALVGHSGCGKSTTIGLLLRYYEQTAGVVRVGNSTKNSKFQKMVGNGPRRAFSKITRSLIAGIRTVMAFNAQPFEIHRYEKELKDARKMGVPDIDPMSDDGLTPEEFVGRISFNNVHFSYPSRPTVKVLDGVNYEVNPGETVALVGHSGCGKSTTIGLLLRYYEQTAGVVALDGIPLREYNLRWWRGVIGVVQQEPVIFRATVAENVRMGDDSLSDADVEEACELANALVFIRKLSEGFNTVIGEGAVQLSGGQKQRIAIARALVRNPQILLLDEATSALDTESEHAVQQALDKVHFLQNCC